MAGPRLRLLRRHRCADGVQGLGQRHAPGDASVAGQRDLRRDRCGRRGAGGNGRGGGRRGRRRGRRGRAVARGAAGGQEEDQGRGRHSRAQGDSEHATTDAAPTLPVRSVPRRSCDDRRANGRTAGVLGSAAHRARGGCGGDGLLDRAGHGRSRTATAVIVDGSGGALPLQATFAELNDVTNRLSTRCSSAWHPRERLIWCGPNSLQVVVVLGAARKVRLVAVPLSYRFTAEEMAYVVDNSDATCVIADAEQAPLLASVADQCPKVRTWLTYTATEAPPAVPAPFQHWDEVLVSQPTTEPVLPEDPGFGGQMIYTSGADGEAEGGFAISSRRPG